MEQTLYNFRILSRARDDGIGMQLKSFTIFLTNLCLLELD